MEEKKQRICIRLPRWVNQSLKHAANSHFSGRGKQSQLAEYAVNYYLLGLCDRDNALAYSVELINEELVTYNSGEQQLVSATQLFLTNTLILRVNRLSMLLTQSSCGIREKRTLIIRHALACFLSGRDIFDAIVE